MRTRVFLLATALPFAVALPSRPLAAQSSATPYLSAPAPLPPPSGHYAELEPLSDAPAPGSPLDTLAYPPELYGGYTLIASRARPRYLAPGQVDYLASALDYPANSSAQTRAELDFLLDVQARRTPAEEADALAVASVGYWPDRDLAPDHPGRARNLAHLFYECRAVRGEGCTAERYPRTADLLRGVMNDVRILEFAVKYDRLRARPYQLEPRLAPLREIESPSFVSGHTLWAYAQALTFAELDPANRDRYVALARDIGYSREVMGVHYPSDEEGARQLAYRLLWLMWHDAGFRADLAAARAEWP